MLDHAFRLLAQLLHTCLPHPRGRHRAEPPPPPPPPPPLITQPHAPHPHVHPNPHPQPRPLDDRIRRRATRGLRERRRALYLASLGLDSEPPVPREARVPVGVAGTIG
ncbi:hypothetical protein [Streptomyces bottropensis]|uniref:hypothetical protein n=1 Tax=Streptomyces bottropensis TaxID=42235 RepID=UPI003699704C